MKNKAMTLTEVVVAVALVALCIGGIIAVLIQGVDLGYGIDYAYVAANIAKNKIERIREIRKDKGYSVLAEAAESNTIVDRNGISGDPNGEFMRTTAVDPNYASNLTKVTVSVKYKRRGAFLPVAIELVTLISPHS